MGVVLGGISRMTIPRNSTVLRAAIVVDHADPTQRRWKRCQLFEATASRPARKQKIGVSSPDVAVSVRYKLLWKSVFEADEAVSSYHDQIPSGVMMEVRFCSIDRRG
ncbi:hypothetical protein F2Q70_00019960 [Brassica cretica]|uniref:Uncharacterized protein n=1 Tax=Brassica cretica TaxID=69181 RepID=A0A8S9GRL3_BRACR|nr:hypothetical protein F2Q70_00019960 [Brassica cretica]KAF2556753.1 hypothetical protein F2Q68_00013428 [Brassica cretica]